MFKIFERTKAYADLNSAEFEKELKNNKDAVVLDVRSTVEFRSGKIQGAINIDLMSSDFDKRVAALDKNKTYLVYCRSGNRSAQACSVMTSLGVKSANLSGGIISWKGELK